MLEHPVEASADIKEMVPGESGDEIDHHFDAVVPQETNSPLKAFHLEISANASQRTAFRALESNFHSGEANPSHLLSHPWINRFGIAFRMNF